MACCGVDDPLGASPEGRRAYESSLRQFRCRVTARRVSGHFESTLPWSADCGFGVDRASSGAEWRPGDGEREPREPDIGSHGHQRWRVSVRFRDTKRSRTRGVHLAARAMRCRGDRLHLESQGFDDPHIPLGRGCIRRRPPHAGLVQSPSLLRLGSWRAFSAAAVHRHSVAITHSKSAVSETQCLADG